MQVPDIETHYKNNFNKLVKKMSFRAGSVAAGEDIVQTAYERALRYRKSCDPNRFPNWFSMLLNNAFRDFKKEENGYSPAQDDDEEKSSDLSCPHFPNYLMQEIHELIQTKSEAQIEVLDMYFKYEYSAKDIAAITEYSYARAHQIIQRFRNELKELYGE